MSALRAVTALTNKGNELMYKSHFARSAEKFGAAADAAQALGHADCLITANLRAHAANMLLSSTQAPGVSLDDKVAIFLRIPPLLRSAIPMLLRRKAAGTLMAGACRPHEVEWSRLTWGHWSEIEAAAAGLLDWEWKAPYVGYEAYLTAATVALYFLSVGANPNSPEAAAFVRFAVSAVDVMSEQSARVRSREPLDCEYLFASCMMQFHDSIIFSADLAVRQLLQDAWARLQQSNVARDHDLIRLCIARAPKVAALLASEQVPYAPDMLRGCALDACAAREVHPGQYKKCAACLAVAYCCREHQVAHWPSHKAACKAARKAAAQGGKEQSKRA